jgi:anti-sigma factor RsiW
MIVTHEELAAYADGELEGAEAARVVLAVAASPELMRVVQRHRALRERIGAEFAPILRQKVPERLVALLRPPEEEISRGPKLEPEVEARVLGSTARQLEQQVTSEPRGAVLGAGRRVLQHRAWLVVPLLAGALALAAFLPGGA